MLVLVPEPVWKTSSGKWSSKAPKDSSDAASWMAAATSFGITRRRPLTVAATPLIEAEGVDQLRRHPLAGDREVLDGPLRLRAPPGRDRDAHLAQRVVLDPHLPFVVVGDGRRSGGGGHGRHATAGPSPRDTVTGVPEFEYQDLLPLGPDDTPYRLLTTDGVSTFEAGGEPVPARSSPRRSRCSPARRCATSPTCCGPGTWPAAARHPRRPRGLGQRPLRGARPAEERQHRRRRRAADVPGHRHRHRQGQEGPVRASPAAATRRPSPAASSRPTTTPTCATRRWRR